MVILQPPHPAGHASLLVLLAALPVQLSPVLVLHVEQHVQHLDIAHMACISWSAKPRPHAIKQTPEASAGRQ